MPKTAVKIVFGDVEFSGPALISATLVEEFSPLSVTLPVNLLEFSVYSSDTSFSVINPVGKFESFATMQPMAVYVQVDNNWTFIGQYYLDDWFNESENVKSFKCVDIFGLLEEVDNLGGLWMTPITAGELVSYILDPLDIDYQIDPEIAAMELVGWLPKLSVREALQQVAFAVGAYVNTSRNDSIVFGKLVQTAVSKSGIRTGVPNTGQTRVYQLRWRPTQEYVYSSGGYVTKGLRSGVPQAGQSRIWAKRWRSSQWEGVKPTVEIPEEQQSGRVVSLRSLVTGVEVVSHNIVTGTGKIELVNTTMAAGQHLITFPQPAHTLSVTGATIVESGANYAVLEVATAGAVLLTGLVYVNIDNTFSMYLDPMPANQKNNVIRIEDATLVSTLNGYDVCKRVYDYYQQRYLQTMKLIAPNQYVEVGAMVDLETLYGNRLIGVVEKMDSDLVGGYVAATEVVGVVK